MICGDGLWDMQSMLRIVPHTTQPMIRNFSQVTVGKGRPGESSFNYNETHSDQPVPHFRPSSEFLEVSMGFQVLDEILGVGADW